MNDQVSTNDILEAINASSSETQKQFDLIREQMGQMLTKQEFREFQLHMIDKMSEGFADIEGVTVSRQRKEDQKVNLILDLLERHKVAPIEEIEHVRSIRLFPQAVE
ncbi:MAG: hypothetical protein AAB413_03265 [Patescibacteria group bacterium]